MSVNVKAKINPETMTISSISLTNLVDTIRKEGGSFLQHNAFIRKATKILGTDSVKMFEGDHQGGFDTEKCLHLPEREACLMMMSYDYDLQIKIYDAFMELKEAKELNIKNALELVNEARSLAKIKVDMLEQALELAKKELGVFGYIK